MDDAADRELADDERHTHEAEVAFLHYLEEPSPQAAHNAELAIARLQRERDRLAKIQADGETDSELRLAAAELQRERNEARVWAWAEVHRRWDYSWFPAEQLPRSPDGEWMLPPWLRTNVTPDQQVWWNEPPPDAG
jgi:hypothetical protein